MTAAATAARTPAIPTRDRLVMVCSSVSGGLSKIWRCKGASRMFPPVPQRRAGPDRLPAGMRAQAVPRRLWRSGWPVFRRVIVYTRRMTAGRRRVAGATADRRGICHRTDRVMDFSSAAPLANQRRIVDRRELVEQLDAVAGNAGDPSASACVRSQGSQGGAGGRADWKSGSGSTARPIPRCAAINASRPTAFSSIRSSA